MGEKEEILSLEDIKEKLNQFKKDDEKLSFLKKFIKNKNYENIQKEIVGLAYEPLLKSKKPTEYNLIYDSLSEGLEHIYFWLLDFMRDKAPGGLGLDVPKGKEEFEASITSGYFGEMGARTTQMQAKAMEYLGAINVVIKSILNLIYDLNEFEIRIQNYDDYRSKSYDEKRRGELALKGIWMDNVDVRAGRGSINALSQELNFATLRDAFLIIENDKSIDQLDLNERVKRILKIKLDNFNSWVNRSEVELKNRFNLEKAYLKSQVGALKLYASWVKPYLIAAQKLKMKDFKTPNIVNAFSNLEMELNFFGKAEIQPGNVRESFKKIKTNKKFYAVIMVKLSFRTVPQAVEGRGGRHYIHAGRTEMKFSSYAMDDIELSILEKQELYEDLELVEQWVSVSLQSLSKDIEKYIKENVYGEKREEKTKAKKEPILTNPFKGAFSGLGELIPFKELLKPQPKTSWMEKEVMKVAKEKADFMCHIIYYVYKKAHGMIDIPD